MDKPIVKLLTYTPEPEKIIASAARLCYANTVSIDTLMDNLSEDKIETISMPEIVISKEEPAVAPKFEEEPEPYFEKEDETDLIDVIVRVAIGKHREWIHNRDIEKF